MIRSFLKATALGLSAAGLICLAGCTKVSRQDVNAARDKAQEEQQEANEARQNAQEKIAEQEQKTEEVRRKAFRPNYDEEGRAAIRRQEEKTAEVRQNAAEEVNQQQKQANQAAAEANRTEARFEAQKARDAYVKDAELQLTKVDEQIAQMKDEDAKLTGAQKDAFDKKLDLIKDRRSTAQDALDDVKSADLKNWEAARDDLERAMKNLTQALNS